MRMAEERSSGSNTQALGSNPSSPRLSGKQDKITRIRNVYKGEYFDNDNNYVSLLTCILN